METCRYLVDVITVAEVGDEPLPEENCLAPTTAAVIRDGLLAGLARAAGPTDFYVHLGGPNCESRVGVAASQFAEVAVKRVVEERTKPGGRAAALSIRADAALPAGLKRPSAEALGSIASLREADAILARAGLMKSKNVTGDRQRNACLRFSPWDPMPMAARRDASSSSSSSSAPGASSGRIDTGGFADIIGLLSQERARTATSTAPPASSSSSSSSPPTSAPPPAPSRAASDHEGPAVPAMTRALSTSGVKRDRDGVPLAAAAAADAGAPGGVPARAPSPLSAPAPAPAVVQPAPPRAPSPHQPLSAAPPLPPAAPQHQQLQPVPPHPQHPHLGMFPHPQQPQQLQQQQQQPPPFLQPQPQPQQQRPPMFQQGPGNASNPAYNGGYNGPPPPPGYNASVATGQGPGGMGMGMGTGVGMGHNGSNNSWNAYANNINNNNNHQRFGNGGGMGMGMGGGGVTHNYAGFNDSALPRVPGLGPALRDFMGGGNNNTNNNNPGGGMGMNGGMAGGGRMGMGGPPPPAAPAPARPLGFVTGSDQLRIEEAKDQRKFGGGGGGGSDGGGGAPANGPKKKVGLSKAFRAPARMEDNNSNGNNSSSSNGAGGAANRASSGNSNGGSAGGAGAAAAHGGSKLLAEYGDNIPDCLKNCDPAMVAMIENEILNTTSSITFDDIAGLEGVKACLYDGVVMPLLNPTIFTGLMAPPKGVLLWGPPGTGKTMIGRAAAAECGATFFAISASALTSKWIGESEKMVRTLFAVAHAKAPSIIFVDEIDSLLSMRTEGEHDSSRRIKTEFLVQMEGLSSSTTAPTQSVLLIGATNRPQELDDAARRRFTKRFYVPLPEKVARMAQLKNLLKGRTNGMSDADFEVVAEKTEGYSGADIKNVCQTAAMSAFHRADLTPAQIQALSTHDLPPVMLEDFTYALQTVSSTVAQKDIAPFVEWGNTYGTKPSERDLRSYEQARKNKAAKAAAAAEAALLAAASGGSAGSGMALDGPVAPPGFAYGGGAGGPGMPDYGNGAGGGPYGRGW